MHPQVSTPLPVVFCGRKNFESNLVFGFLWTLTSPSEPNKFILVSLLKIKHFQKFFGSIIQFLPISYLLLLFDALIKGFFLQTEAHKPEELSYFLTVWSETSMNHFSSKAHAIFWNLFSATFQFRRILFWFQHSKELLVDWVR